MKKTQFTPAPDQLEGRIVLSSGPKFVNGAAVLTEKALGQTYSDIQGAFNRYANRGQNLNRLQVDLAKAVDRIPYNHRDGLLGAVQSEVSQMVADGGGGAATPVKSAMRRALADVNAFVQGEIAGGAIIMGSKARAAVSQVARPGGARFINGSAVLTRKALNQTYSDIQGAFNRYANRGQNLNRLQVDLAKAVDRIPYNHRDGLLGAVQSEVSQMVADGGGGAATPVKSAMRRALADVGAFVQGEAAGGVIVLR